MFDYVFYDSFFIVSVTSKDKQFATIFLKQNLHGRLYGLLLGNEIVSSLRTVNLILDGNSSAKFTPVNCSSQVLSRYKKSRDLEKEFIGRALLVGLTFMELIVYQNLGCMEILNFADKFLPHTD